MFQNFSGNSDKGKSQLQFRGPVLSVTDVQGRLIAG
jgi:hypothetical protein